MHTIFDGAERADSKSLPHCVRKLVKLFMRSADRSKLISDQIELIVPTVLQRCTTSIFRLPSLPSVILSKVATQVDAGDSWTAEGAICLNTIKSTFDCPLYVFRI